ncbi:hypothetical protein [Streptomyces sp. NL15-2K]|uniref:hypothetical protein n=1 Tax=Streptomyces sp. NL15-2K TaxID=376149 RepID=UPI000F58D379|nr:MULTISPECIES: hypothetical protein [Actinomycetes]WKX15962.1 hypothetical protein Q4V64_54190 [Kutzneria buriramensis]GCB53381.1 hypothetical protein SNL152K_10738 [Streptomyces sp. NL15-2K]
MTAATYQYVDLPDASVVTTRALLTARENITDTVAARAMMCIHGGAGFRQDPGRQHLPARTRTGRGRPQDHLSGPAHRPRGAL